ncbi:MAG: hypothetical protein HWD61_04485 [Parachlamydiaceae bacterium]|nr:MAG: hypothetical protein HWD61_04485 [Parachlamydiaceae bacterium]
MESYKIVQNPHSFKLSLKYEEINSSRKGETVLYKGNSYKILCEAQYLKSQRIKRLALGILASVLTFGLAYLCFHKIKSLIDKNHRIYIHSADTQSADTQSKAKELGLQTLRTTPEQSRESHLEEVSEKEEIVNAQNGKNTQEEIDCNPLRKAEEAKIRKFLKMFLRLPFTLKKFP